LKDSKFGYKFDYKQNRKFESLYEMRRIMGKIKVPYELMTFKKEGQTGILNLI